MYFAMKTLISALVIALVTKLSEKQILGAALIKSLPLTSFLVFFFMKYEGRTDQEFKVMSWDILKMVIPSLLLFVVFPVLLDKGWGFYLSLAGGTVVMCLAYLATFRILA
jgi:hypothetical protein